MLSMVSSDLIFVYDGECPFCNHFAELIELKSNLPNVQIRNARENPNDLPVGYDMDIKGAILIKDGKLFNGASAINQICSHINQPSDSLLKLLTIVFSSQSRATLIFPILIIARRITLFIKGVPTKLGV